MHCKGTVCSAAHNRQLSVCFSCLSILSVLLSHVWYMKDFSGFPHPLPFWIFFMFVLHCLPLISSSLSCSSHSPVSTLEARGAKIFPQWNQLSALALYILLSVVVSVTQSMYQLPVSSICASVWPSERSMPCDKVAHKGMYRYLVCDDAYKLRVWQMHLGEALVPEAHCSTTVLDHGNNCHRNSSRKRNCISHSQCLIMPVPAHSITHLKPDGVLSLPVLFCYSCVLRPSLEHPSSEALGNKSWKKLNISVSLD